MAQPGQIEIQVVSPSPPRSPIRHLARNSETGPESGSFLLPHYPSPDMAQDFSRGKRRRKKKEKKKRKDLSGRGDSASTSTSYSTCPDISESSRELKWYIALREENCVAAMELLHECPKLAWQGWKVDPEMQGFDSSYPRRRTALLVGARRGCPVLVKMVLAIFQDEEGKGDDLLQGGVEDLLVAKDPRYELDALDIARFHGNREIISILANTSLKCKANPYDIHDPVEWQEDTAPENKRMKDQIRQATEDVMFSEADGGFSFKQEYMLDYNFNFLPWEEYLFSFSCGSSCSSSQSMSLYERSLRWRIWNKVGLLTGTGDLEVFLLHLQDGLGRTALHVAVEGDRVEQFLLECTRNSVNSLRDGLGRTAVHWAAALGKAEGLQHLLPKYLGVPREPLDPSHFSSIDSSWLANRQGLNNGGQSVGLISPLGLAIIHNHVECVDTVLLDSRKENRLLSHYFPFQVIHCNKPNCPPKFQLGALQLATILGHAPMVRLLLEDGRLIDKGSLRQSLRQQFNITMLNMLNVANTLMEKVGGYFASTRWIPRNLQEFFGILLVFPIALPIGCIHNLLLVDSFYLLKGEPTPTQQLHAAIQIAAGCGRFGLIKTFLEHGHKHYDLFVKDENGNNALHHVMLGMDNDYYGHQHFKFETKLFENVTLEQVVKKREVVESLRGKGDKSKLAFIERQGCVELLMQAGFDPWIVNNKDEAPHPGEDAPSEFFSWWFDKLTKEIVAAQNTLNAAANAISVTAALVATASYVGPLQPPLNYKERPNLTPQVYGENSFVKIFMIFDTMSFFFSVCAIMMAIIPSIPIPRQSARIELQRTRTIVNIAIGLLFPAIVFVLIAFAAASIAVAYDDETSKLGVLTMIPIVISGLLCLFVIFLFLVRLLVVVDKFPRIRSFYYKLRF